jgi:hypothetical protein
LALGVADGASQKFRDLVMFVAVNVMKHEDHAVTLWEQINSPLQGHSVGSTTEIAIVTADEPLYALSILAIGIIE